MNKFISIAIDGPSASGKSTIAKTLCDSLNKGKYINNKFRYVKTGELYRSVAYYFYMNNIDIEDDKVLKKICDNLDIKIKYINDIQHTIIDNIDVTDKLKDEDIGYMASKLSVKIFIREKLNKIQRDFLKYSNIIMEGRDIGTVVIPNADLKIYLDASVEKRTERRYLELKKLKIDESLEYIKETIVNRDYKDKNRKIAPLKQAKDAVYIFCDNKSIEEIVNIIKNKLNKWK